MVLFQVMNDSPEVNLWGSGYPYREFLHVDDMADACLFLMQLDNAQDIDSSRLFNVGVGADLTIRDVAELTQRIVGFDGKVNWDSSKPDGTPRKLMDVNRLNEMGWHAEISLGMGIEQAYRSYLSENSVAVPLLAQSGAGI